MNRLTLGCFVFILLILGTTSVSSKEEYNIKNEKVLKEKKYDFHKSVHVNDIISINNGKSYGIIYSTDQGDKLEEFELR